MLKSISILNSDVEYMKPVNTTMRQRAIATDVLVKYQWIFMYL